LTARDAYATPVAVALRIAAQVLYHEQKPEEPTRDVRQLLRHVPFRVRPVNQTELALSLATRFVVVVFTGG
jgi:hypothetical protein